MWEMHTTDKIINDVAVQLANKIIECANYKAYYEQTNELLTKFNDILASDSALKDLFDEASQKLEEGE
jgi:hypothetical protein